MPKAPSGPTTGWSLTLAVSGRLRPTLSKPMSGTCWASAGIPVSSPAIIQAVVLAIRILLSSCGSSGLY
jgi:hypothetical protein